MKKVLFLCTGNSCRSQMAEGLLHHYYGDKYEVYSAGTKPSIVHPKAIQIMQEIGIDISNQRSKSVNEFKNESFDYVITVCDNAKESCPIFPGKSKRLHWSFIDPAEAIGDTEQVLTVFRMVLEQIKQKIDQKLL
ncbi:MAG: hypothetical protein A2287_05325 [Candidatus Melainabacteria bacterium RIFOXYA12_FULL_32_12]|nr:MAG: hypothetical protein A2255_08050 [Candidatus Melainabacteria bacterium RIFOXYA2_FULL_32_9]OGI31693.1 MAG: hypothetical protein A2287_05325 [Candidatus Melainabacteria bacterium RIFOXYA12_FULL_32_12]